MSPLLQFLAFFALMFLAAGPVRALLLASFEVASPHLSFGTWFFAGCCILWCSPQACHALSSSVTAVASLVRGLAEMSRDTTVATLRAQIQAFQQPTGTANSPSNTYQDASQQLMKDRDALQRGYDASLASIKALHLTVDQLQNKASMYERHYNVVAVEMDRAKAKNQVQILKQELLVRDEEIKRLHEADRHRREGAAKSSNAMNSLARKNDELRSALEAKTKRVNELEPLVLQHGRDMYQRDIQVAKFSSFKEMIHQMTEEGGDQMIVVVLFLRYLVEKGVDLAEMGVDESLFLTYRDYAEAVAGRRPSPLFPQGMSS
ncbi:uncharacterized protein K460DRAFT_206697 [Cucurbitaria berberidis CBS 394.84]|uniref:Nuf2 DHR10-like domain-containing protein n=1 Tax=Cucurbitaria berberidis CBS 394.84 TaxID=1168544 RepID=A0A9P4L3I0_9PLEO|nr:uncharacterized protein K460DRAFT_206697 [Cucurbitaria berberidis CBS 394.84]KAF1840337.1 hypothetical protein K460DRAFT_206697 [Cucurbitaria berberidis CBS 394.84]